MKTKYTKIAEDGLASFTPFLSTCEAMFDHEAIVYFKKTIKYVTYQMGYLIFPSTWMVEGKTSNMLLAISQPLHPRFTNRAERCWD